MDRAAYNAKVQDMQKFCIAAGMENRVIPRRYEDGQLTEATFEVYYGKWRILGTELKPMQPDVSRWYDDDEDSMIRAMVAHDISR